MATIILIIIQLLRPAIASAQENCPTAPDNSPAWSDQFIMPTPAPVSESEFSDIFGGDDVGSYSGGDGDPGEGQEVTCSSSTSAPRVSDPECQKLLDLAYAQLCKPYIYGTSGPNSFDCSGFTKYVFKNAWGVDLPHGSTSTYNKSCIEKIPPDYSLAQPCDLIFWRYPNATKATSHIGIYVGNKSAIHAGSPVKVTYLPGANWLKRYIVGFGRVTNCR